MTSFYQVEATSFFHPDIFEQANIQDGTQQVLQQLRRVPRIAVGTLPAGHAPRPLLAIVAPPASHAAILTLSLTMHRANRTRLLVTHTTELKKFKHGFFTIERLLFNDMAQRGEFAIIYEIYEHLYGISKQNNTIYQGLRTRDLGVIAITLK